jgi:ribosomal-protein-alanine N-acetyltransferase
MSIVKTKRLVMVPYSEVDFSDFANLRSDESVMVSMVGGTTTGAAARDLFDAYLEAWESTRIGMWAIRGINDDSYVGECGFWDRGGEVGLTVRYLLHKKYWGQGLAGEAVGAAVTFGLETAGIKSLSAVALKENTRSCVILERLGMTVNSENHQGIDGFRHYVLSLNE